MKSYLMHSFDHDDPELISVMDELPLWSAPFGLALLNTIKLKYNMKVLDIGSGLGFPLLEIAQRLGNTSKVYGIDPWEAAIDRANLKIRKYNLTNVEIRKGEAESLPFGNSFFDLIVSNNGINNVGDMKQALSECFRVMKPDGQFVFTLNLEESMIEFYDVLEEALRKNKLTEELIKMKEQIYSKRKPLDEIISLTVSAGFKVKNIQSDKFHLNYADGTAMFNHPLIKYWFLPGWKSIMEAGQMEEIFDEVEARLNMIAKNKGELQLTIPFVTVECKKE